MERRRGGRASGVRCGLQRVRLMHGPQRVEFEVMLSPLEYLLLVRGGVWLSVIAVLSIIEGCESEVFSISPVCLTLWSFDHV